MKALILAIAVSYPALAGTISTTCDLSISESLDEGQTWTYTTGGCVALIDVGQRYAHFADGEGRYERFYYAYHSGSIKISDSIVFTGRQVGSSGFAVFDINEWRGGYGWLSGSIPSGTFVPIQFGKPYTYTIGGGWGVSEGEAEAFWAIRSVDVYDADKRLLASFYGDAAHFAVPTPEPSSVAVFAAGLVGIALKRRLHPSGSA